MVVKTTGYCTECITRGQLPFIEITRFLCAFFTIIFFFANKLQEQTIYD